jgi:signal-transduction protein with cAMP-binding, CBS, and nucleotidyltransferase domain
MKQEVYMKNEFITRCGSKTEDLYIILDGEAGVFGINNELLFLMRNGSHIWNNDPNGSNENFDSKSIMSIVANSLVIVGIIKITDAL